MAPNVMAANVMAMIVMASPNWPADQSRRPR
jgi:hypothetical protein